MLINNKHSFLKVLGAEKYKIMAPADLVAAEKPLSGSQTAVFLLCPHIVEGTRELPEVSFIRALMRAPSL